MNDYKICLTLAVIIIVQLICHAIERRNLYNRIMAKDLTEYKGAKPRPIKNVIRKNIKEQNSSK